MNKYIQLNNEVFLNSPFRSKKIVLIGLLLSLLISYKVAFCQSLIAHYPFNNSVEDISPYRNKGNIIGGVTAIQDRFGNPCSAMLFDGSTGYIEVPTSASLESPSSELSITVWYKLTKTNTENYWLTVLCKGSSPTEMANDPQYRLQAQQNTNVQINSCNQFSASASSTISMATGFTICDPDFQNHLFEPDVWHFYALTYNGNTVKAFMDGIKIFEYQYSGNLALNKSPLFIGRDEPGSLEFYNGALDDLKIYNYCLSESLVQKAFSEKEINSFAEEFEISFPQNIVTETASGTCNAKVYFPAPSVKSNCGNISVSQIEGLPSGSFFPVGSSRIRFQASSSSGYTQVVTSYVVVKDIIPPVLFMPPDTIIYIPNGKRDVAFSYTLPVVYDNCGIKEMTLIEGPQPGGLFPLGKNRIGYQATDKNNNSSKGYFKVEIKELSVVDSNIVVPVTDSAITTKPTQQLPILLPDTLSVTEYKPNNILFLVDVSSSMAEGDKILYLKLALENLIKRLRVIDHLTLITYADSVKLIYKTNNLSNKTDLLALIHSLVPFGGTSGEQGIEIAYDIMERNFYSGSNNEIYLATDGLFNVSKKQKKLIKNSASSKTKQIKLNILAFGFSDAALKELRSITDIGNGQYLSINSIAEAKNLLLEQIKKNSKKQ